MNDSQGSGMLGRLRQRAASQETTEEPPSQDSVTGLDNRHLLPAALTAAITTSKTSSSVAVLSFVEVGGVRDINDCFGPDIGDHLLRQVGKRLGNIDLPGTRVFRYEGAVFAVLFENVPGLHGAEESARFLLEYLADPFLVESIPVMINPTIGAAVSTDSYRVVDDMIRDAADALSRARVSPTDSIVVHDESKRGRYETRVDERRLRDAADSDEFQLHYQPVIRLADGKLVGVEALLRWEQPGATNNGVLYPHDFLPLLEKSGLIVRVGEWALAEACRQVHRWQSRFPTFDPLFVSCNIGPRQLADPGFSTAVARAVDGSGISPGQLCLDLTETALRQNQFEKESTWAALRLLKNIGVKIAIGDFGTGNSSLHHLRDFQVDILRMHRLFVSGLGISPEDPLIFEHMAALAHDLGCQLVAEGVETEEQAVLLAPLGVDLAQGFYFGRPDGSAQIDTLIESLLADEADRS